MLARPWTALALCLVLVCVLLASRGGSAPPAVAFSPEKPHPVEISARLDKQEAAPGDTIRLVELIPSSEDAMVGAIDHDILLIGRFNKKLGKLMNLQHDYFGSVPAHKAFDKLPGMLHGSHAFDFGVRNPRQKGMEFEFRPKWLGIYLITTTWDFRNRKDRFVSNPVVLVVKPPMDAKGQPVVKPEWLPKLEWLADDD